MTATRYFQHRVKQFIRTIMMGKNNPMHVKYYTYKVEFQDRGAGHIHGTLWLNMDKIEEIETENGEKPFLTLKSAFKKFRNHGSLEDDEITCVKTFIDEYTTVSIHEGTVGKEVAKIANEVSKQYHTKTRCKHN